MHVEQSFMNVTVLFFGISREKAGCSEIVLKLDGCDLIALKSALLNEYPKLKDIASWSLAVNSEYVLGNSDLSDGDEVAVIPPVSGG